MLEIRVKDPRLGFVTVTDARVTVTCTTPPSSTPCTATRPSARRHRRGAGERQGRAAHRSGPADRGAVHTDSDVRRRRHPRHRQAHRRSARARGPRGRGRAAPGRRRATGRGPRSLSRAAGGPRGHLGVPTCRTAYSSSTSPLAGPRTTSSRESGGWPRPSGSDMRGRWIRWLPASCSLAWAATRLLGHLALRDKAYDATIRLGQSTVTDDSEGDLLRRGFGGAPRSR